MPAKSENQRVAAAVALAVKRGKTPKKKLRGASRKMYGNMTASQLADYARKYGGR